MIEIIYPLEEKNSYLNKIRDLRNRYKCPIGHSDHTPGTNIPILASAVGANIIEKHFTDNPKHRLSDNFFSITKEQLIKIKFDLEYVHKVLYSPSFDKDDPEKFIRIFSQAGHCVNIVRPIDKGLSNSHPHRMSEQNTPFVRDLVTSVSGSLYRKFKDHGFEMLTISVDKDQTLIEPFMKKFNLLREDGRFFLFKKVYIS